jgi:hypothetical protein
MSLTEAYAATITATSCSSAHVQEAINSASRGDTVSVPAGKCTWSGEVTIDKAIRILGAGIDRTTIVSNLPISSGTYVGYWLFKYTPSNPSADINEIFEITGFTFDNASRAGSIAARNLSLTPINKLKIHDNKFVNCIGGVYSGRDYVNTIMIEGTVYGVVYKNSFNGLPHVDNYGYTAGGGGLNTWNGVTWQPGSEKAIYYEDNIFEKTFETESGRDHLIFSSDKGVAYVVRYNTLINHYGTMVGFDMHGIQRGGTPSNPTWISRATMGMEAYGNKIINTVGDTFVSGQGGGRGLVFYNYINNGSRTNSKHIIHDAHSDAYSLTNHACTSSTNFPYAVSACSSDGERQRVTKSYYFNNRKSSDNRYIYLLHYQLSSYGEWGGNKLIENVHFFQNNENCTPTSCSSGIGCGSATPTGACATGVGYWKTDQSCTSVPIGSYGANPTTPISGTLYRCASTNNWRTYYSPYIYPHPLRSDDREDISAPKGFKVVY